MRAIDFAVSKVLPEDMRRDTYDLGKNGMAAIMAEVATKHPDKFAEIVQKLGDLGRHAAWRQGYTTAGRDTRQVIDTGKYYAQMDAELAKLHTEKLPPDEFDDRRSEIMTRYSDLIERDTMAAAMKNRNAFALAVASGARGNASHVKAILSTPGVFQDSKGRTIPLFVRNSFGDGVRPAETLAGSYGARTSVVSTKRCLAAGTMVRMADGSQRSIETIRPGERVMGADCMGRLRPATVTRFYDQGLQDCWEWRMRVGYGRSRQEIILHATDEHRLLSTSLRSYNRVSSAKKRGQDVDPTPYYHEMKIAAIGSKEHRFAAVLPTSPAVLGGVGVYEPYAMIMGLLAGDGCLTESKQGRGIRLIFSCADESLKVDLLPYLRQLGMKITRHSLLNYDCEFVQEVYDRSAHAACRTAKGVQGFTVAARHASKLALIDSGMLGCYAHEKVLPPAITGWDQHSVESYLAGLLAADGCFHKNDSGATILGLYLTSETLVRQISELLLWRYGIAQAAFIRREDYQTVDGARQPRKHPLYGFQFGGLCELRKLAAVFAMMPGEKGRKARESLRKVEKQSNPFTKAYIRRGAHLGEVHCYDIEVDCEDHLFMLASGVIVSNSTAQGGDILKIMTQSTLNYNVTEKDCGAQNGLAMDAENKSITGRVLARDVGDIPAGTVVDRRVLAQIRQNGKPAVVRSAMTCRAEHGLCASCVGVQADGKFPSVGSSLGVTAAAAIGEPIVQGSLNTKHTGGMAKSKRAFSGLKYLQQFLQIPEYFKDRAAVAESDGIVERVEAAPQGGSYITVNGEKHLVLPGFSPVVKVGDQVEAGDILSEGLANPADIVRLRGLGEGRKYYAERLAEMLKDSGQNPDMRNVEILARAAVDNYQVEDPDEDDPWLPDDLVRENELLKVYKPADDTSDLPLDRAGGKYLQAPVLHYTVGTKLSPKMLQTMRDVGVERVPVSAQSPRFRAEMPRLRVASHDSSDWLASLGTSYLSSQMRDSLERGDETNIKENWHFGPRLAFGVGFGEKVEQTGKF